METTTSIKEIRIGSDLYTIKKMGARKSIRVLTRLGKMLGEPLVRLMQGDGVGSKKIEAVVAAVGSFLLRAEPDEVDSLIQELMAEVFVQHSSNSVTNDFDIRFQDKIDHVFTLSKEVVNHNYERFFDKVAGLAQKFEAVTEKAQ